MPVRGCKKVGCSFVFCLAESKPATRRIRRFVFLFFLKTKQKQVECREENVFVDSRAAQSGPPLFTNSEIHLLIVNDF